MQTDSCKVQSRVPKASLVILALAGLFGVPAALADEETEREDARSASRLKPGLFHLDYAEAYLEFETGYEERRVKYSSQGSANFPFRRGKLIHENHQLEFRETLGLTLGGDIVDPNLIDWRLGLELGLAQSDYREVSYGWAHDDFDTGFLGEYDLSLDLFKAKPLSVNVYARRTDDRIPRRFLPSLDEEVTETGVTALALTGPVTTEFGFSYRDVDRSGNRFNEDDERLQQTRFFIDSKWEISEHHRLRLAYDHIHDEYNYQGSGYDFQTQRDDFRVEHELAFGPDHKHMLDTLFRFSTENGDLARDEIQLVPRLTLQHSDKFKTVYRYSLYRFDQGSIRVQQHKFDVEALYRPNDRWRISLDGYGLYERVDHDVETYEFGGGLDVAYTRPTSLGEFNANAAFSYDQSRTVGAAGDRVVRGEAHHMGGVRPVFLKNRYAEVRSIVVRNATRTRIYVLGIDYYIQPIGHRVRLQRIPSGRIAHEEVVYVDYRYRVPAQSTVHTYRGDLLVEHRFEMGLIPYYSLESRCQQVEATQSFFLGRDNTNRHRFGLKFERERWAVGGEYELFDDTIEPYDAYHLTGRVALIQSAAHTLDAALELSRYDFDGGYDDRSVWWLDIDVTDRMQINRFLSATAGAAYRWEDDSEDGETDSVDARLGLQYQRGYLTVELTAEYDLLSLADSREDGLGIWLKVRRDLGHLIGSSRRTR